MGIMGRDLYKKDEGIAPVDGLENESVSQGQGKRTCSSIPFCLREDSLCPHRASMKAFSGASWDGIISSLPQIRQAGGKAGCMARRASFLETMWRRSEWGGHLGPCPPTCPPGSCNMGLVSLGCIGQKVQFCDLQPSLTQALGSPLELLSPRPGPWPPTSHTCSLLCKTGLTRPTSQLPCE